MNEISNSQQWLLNLISKQNIKETFRLSAIVFYSADKPENYKFINWHLRPHSQSLINDLDFLLRHNYIIFKNNHYQTQTTNLSNNNLISKINNLTYVEVFQLMENDFKLSQKLPGEALN